MIVLGIDTSSSAAVCSAVNDGVILGDYILNNKKTHSQKLLPNIERLLSDIDIGISDIDVFACGIGPGSFTGLRIGVAAVKGLAQSLGKRVVAVNSLELLAHNAVCFDGTVVPLIFARADEAFFAGYENGIEVFAPSVAQIEKIYELFEDKKCLFIGDGSVAFKERLGKNAIFASPEQNIIRGSSIGYLGYKKALENKSISYNELTPLYLRVSQAEREFGK